MRHKIGIAWMLFVVLSMGQISAAMEEVEVGTIYEQDGEEEDTRLPLENADELGEEPFPQEGNEEPSIENTDGEAGLPDVKQEEVQDASKEKEQEGEESFQAPSAAGEEQKNIVENEVEESKVQEDSLENSKKQMTTIPGYGQIHTQETVETSIFTEMLTRTIDELPTPQASVYARNVQMLDVAKETKYYEVYTSVTSEQVETVEVVLEIEEEQTRFQAEEGEFQVEEESYNWRLRIPYEELGLEGSDGFLTTSFAAYSEEGMLIGESDTYETLATGVYDINRVYKADSLDVLATTKSSIQVYYIQGTVWSPGSWDLHCCSASVGSPYTYQYITIKAYYIGDDIPKSVVRLRDSTTNPGRWLEIYGNVTVEGLEIIGTDNATANGLVSAKMPENFSTSCTQSRMFVINCNLYNSSTWAVHGDRYSLVHVQDVNIMDCRGGVGGHGEIIFRRGSISSGKYGISETSSQSVGIHLGIPINQNYKGFTRSLAVEYVDIDGFYKAIEVRTSSLFEPDETIGGYYTSINLKLTGTQGNISNCVYGISFPDTRVSFQADIGWVVNEVNNCKVVVYSAHPNNVLTVRNTAVKNAEYGIQTYGKVTFSGGTIAGCTKQAVVVEEGGTFVQSGGVIQNSPNAVGVEVKGTYQLTSGTIQNCKTGVHLSNGGTAQISGGYILKNSNYGILHEGKQLVLTGGTITDNANGAGGNCDVYLGEGKIIEWDPRGSVKGTVKVDAKSHVLGTQLVEDLYYKEDPSATLASGDAYPFAETTEGKFEVAAGGAFVGRYGNRNQTIAGSLVLSEAYSMRYQDLSGLEIRGLPSTGKKYWQEAYQVSVTIPWLVGYEDKPLFLGWDTNGDESVDVQPGAWLNQNQNMTFVAVWKLYPEIVVQQEHTFYEGVDVFEADLLEGVQATDILDGNLSSAIRVVKISYADGKLVDGEPTKGKTELYPDGMTSEDMFDTWFEAMPKEASPISHTIVYEVTNSIGKTTQLEHEVQILYNEPPEIKAVDRYFTLEEAQAGMITEEMLLSQAIADGKLQVTDLEEDEKDATYMKQAVRLISFSEEEFLTLVGEATIRLEYEVNDQMGPGGQGKKATKICYLYIQEDGELEPKEETSHLRFLNETYYRKNEGGMLETLSEEEVKTSAQNGGLRVDSYWYQKAQYKALLEQCFQEDAQPLVTYRFTDAQCQEAKEWVSLYGVSNLLSIDALQKFYQEVLIPNQGSSASVMMTSKK